MAAGYIPLPAAKYPTNATLDFSPLSQGIDSARQWSQQQHSAMLNDKADVRADEDQKLQRAKFGMQQTQFNDEQQEKIKQRYARAFQVVDTMPEGPDRAAAHERLLKSYPGGGANLDPMYRDPVMGPKRILAEAGMFKDPIEQQKAALGIDLTKSQIAENNAQAARASQPQQARAPQGYRFTTEGNLEAIPGGPASAAGARARVPASVQTDAIKAQQAFDILGPELDKYEELVAGKQIPNDEGGFKTDPKNPGTGGSYMPGSEDDAINRSRRNIQLQLKELFNLGVLNGPDLGLMNEMVVDPNVNILNPLSWSNGYDVANRTRAGISDLKEKLRNMRNAKTRVAGIEDIPRYGDPTQKHMGAQPLPQEAPVRIAGDEDYNQLPSGAHFIGPDNQLRVKP